MTLVCVRVRVENAIDQTDLTPDQLLSKFRSRVDQHMDGLITISIQLEIDPAAGPAILSIERITSSPFVSDPWNAAR